VHDAGSADGGADAGTPDSGTPTCSDGARNGNESDLDCGGSCSPCQNGALCGGPLDCASGLCVGGHCTTPGFPCVAFSGCTNFVDATAPGAARIIQFPGANDRYTPDCLKVRFGQTVTFQGGSFNAHPLAHACQPLNAPSLDNTSGQSFSVTFDQALGVYGYYCTQHGSIGGSGMSGAIEVVR
jgi:plastocyanin